MKPRHEMEQAVKQTQRLILSPQMQQALHLLQMPVMELASLVTEEMAQNPLLEWDEETDLPTPFEEIGSTIRPQKTQREEEDLKSFIENTLPCASSLYETLMAQAREHFHDPHTFQVADWIIGNLDDSGFLTLPLEELAILSDCNIKKVEEVLSIIQTFEPKGVGARSLQETLMIQLRSQGKESSLAYRIVEEGFDHMLKNRISTLTKLLHCTSQQIYHILAHEIAPLDFHPGKHCPSGHYQETTQQIVPDVLFHLIDDELVVEVNKAPLPPLKLNAHYLDLLHEPTTSQDVKSYLQERFQSSKWLMRNLQERQHTLHRIAEKLLIIQGSFLKDPRGTLSPLTMKELAMMLDLHESTIARALAHKYLSCPRGVFPLRDLFTNAYTTSSGDTISSTSVKDCLRDIIAHEDKLSPLSDEAISGLIQKRGISCARRTVAKYRQELNIGNAAQRKSHI